MTINNDFLLKSLLLIATKSNVQILQRSDIHHLTPSFNRHFRIQFIYLQMPHHIPTLALLQLKCPKMET